MSEYHYCDDSSPQVDAPLLSGIADAANSPHCARGTGNRLTPAASPRRLQRPDTIVRALLSVFLITACLLPTAAQEPATNGNHRERAFGIARRANRSPWADATVRLVSQPFPGCAECDLVEVVTNARGEFRAGILVGLPYTAWAGSLSGEQWIVSQRVDDVVPRLPIVLDENHVEARLSLRVRQLAAWRLAGPLTVWCSGERSGTLALPLRCGGDAAVELPPTGTGERWLFPHAGNGLDMLRRRVPADARGTFDLVLPPPHDVAVTVCAPDGTPVAGAQLEIRGVTATVLPQRTGAEGRMTVVVPDPTDEDAGRVPLWASAPEHLTARLWPRGVEPGGPWQFFVTPQPVTAATLEWRAGEPIADAPVWFGGVEQSMEPGRLGPAGTAQPNPQFASDGLHRTDPDGRIVLPYEPSYPLSVAVLLPRRRLSELERRFGAAISPLALLHGSVPSAPSLLLRANALRPVRFVFEHDDRSPAPRAHVRLGGGDSPGLGLEYVADQASSITVLLPPQDDIMVAVWHATAGDVVKVAVPNAPAGEGIADVHVQLPAPIRVTGAVVDAGGEPVAGAVVRLGATLRGRRSEWQPVETEAAEDRPRVVARGYYYQPMAEPMFRRSLRTDDAGRFVCELPSRGYPLEFRVAHDGRSSATEWRDAEAAGDGDVRLVLR